jgi:hypothetical protein
MTLTSTTTLRRAALGLTGLAVFLLAGPTFAEDAPPPVPADPKAADAAALPAAPVPTEDATQAPSPPGGLERMPGEAFWPPPYLRGLYGSSVWLSTGLHGLQWPYYRKTGIGFSGDLWVDNSYEKVTRGDKTEQNVKAWIQQGRFVLRITPTYTHGDWFAQVQAELVANKDQTLKQPDVADTDDLWIRGGQWNKWDIQMGRFQGWEVYHLGMGLDLNTFERQGATDTNNPPPDIYGVTYGYYRPSGVGNVAFHLYPTSWLRFELLGQLGNEQGRNTLGGRPVAILDLGWLKFKVGGEYRKLTQVDPNLKESFVQRGFGAGVIFIFNPIVEFGVNGAIGLVDHTDPRGDNDPTGSYTATSVGGFANVRIVEDLLIGGGFNFTAKEDLHLDMTTGKYGDFTHKQGFGALQYYLYKQVFIKLVVAYSTAHLAPTFSNGEYDNSAISARLRLQFLF